MNVSRADALKLARMWHAKWKEALAAQDFETAERYFKTANEWKQRAQIQGMLDQVEDEPRG